jgi:ABC-type Fe3+ transport system substrate-binding protein
MNNRPSNSRIPSLGVASTIFAILFSAISAFGGEAKPTWELDWERTYEAAKKEGQVVFYGSQVYERIFGEFQKRYPEIKVAAVIGSGNDTVQRILNERRAGKFLADLYLSGMASGYRLYKAQAFDPIKPVLVLPEVVEQKRWWKGRHRLMDEEGQYLFAFNESVVPFVTYNTKLVKQGEIKSYWDLLNPKWKGKMVSMDPAMGSAVDALLVFVYHHPDLGPEFLRRLLSEMEMTASRDARQIVDWLAVGRFSVAVFTTPSRADLDSAKAQGLPLDWIDPKDIREGAGTNSSNGTLGLINRAPHPNAAKMLINWLLSREGQITYQKFQFGADSLRTDIPKDSVPVYARRVEGVKYVETDNPAQMDREPIRKIIQASWRASSAR